MNKIKRKFVISGSAYITEHEKLDLIYKIQSLGGIYYETENFKASATHLIAIQPSLSQKYLSACAAGKWILTPLYIDDSFKSSKWLPEEKYEWNEEHINLNNNLPACIYSAPQICRERVHLEGKGMFYSWKVVLLLEDKMQKSFYCRILKQGGAKLFRCHLPLKYSQAVLIDLTHVFVEKEKESSVQQLLNTDVLCLTPEYIQNFILKNPQPNPQDFLVTKYDSSMNCFDTYLNCTSPVRNISYKNEQMLILLERLNSVEISHHHHSKYNNNSNNGHILQDDSDGDDAVSHHHHHRSDDSSDGHLLQDDNKKIALRKINSNEGMKTNLSDNKQFKAKRWNVANSKIKIRTNKSFHILTSPKSKFCHISKQIMAIKKRMIKKKTETHNTENLYFSKCKNQNSPPSSSSSDCSNGVLPSPFVNPSFTYPPLLYPHVEEKKPLLRSLFPSHYTSLINIYLNSEEYAKAIDLAESFLSCEEYPSYQTLNDVMFKILQVTKDEYLAIKAYSFLCKVFSLHPIKNSDSRQYYLNALFLQKEAAWDCLEKIIYDGIATTLENSSEMVQLMTNSRLLLTFILGVLEQDFQLFLESSSHPFYGMRSRGSCPLVVNIFWPKGDTYIVSHQCYTLFSYLAELLNCCYIFEKKELVEFLFLIQRLIALVAECCRLYQKEVVTSTRVYQFLGPSCNEFSISLMKACADVSNNIKKLQLFITKVQPQWLRVKLCMLFLDQCFIMWNFIPGNNRLPLSFRKIVKQYMFPSYKMADSQKQNVLNELESKDELEVKVISTQDEKVKENMESSTFSCTDSSQREGTPIIKSKKLCEVSIKLQDGIRSEDTVYIGQTLKGVLTAQQGHKYILLILNLLSAYFEMNHIRELTTLLREENQKEETELVHSILSTFLHHEPSVSTVIAASDDLFIAQQFERYQTEFKENINKMCTETSEIPKSLFIAFQLLII